MNERVRVPIRVKRSDGESRQENQENEPAVVESEQPVVEQKPISRAQEAEGGPERASGDGRAPSAASEPDEQATDPLREELETWRDRALRLQAEIENFRKRQRRLAEQSIEADRARLLRNFLRIADDLERALRAEGNEGSLREGVKVTHRSLKQLLKQEGVEQIEAQGETFDPRWHEAVGTVPHKETDVDPDAVVEVTQQGYRLGGRLLRPARVIVAR